MVPALISSAYRGESLPPLNDLITGQNRHPPEYYLDQWRNLGRNALVIFALLGLAVFAWWWARPVTSAIGDRIFRGDPELSPLRVLWLAAWFGAGAGLIEAAHFTIRHLIERHPARSFTWELVWMGPISSTIAFAVVGVLFLVVVRLMVTSDRPLSPVALRVCVFVFSLLAAYGLLQNSRLRLATYAVILLSLGIAVALARLSVSRGQGFKRVMRRSTPVLATVLIAGAAIGLWNMPSRVEQRRLATLPPAASGLPNVLLIILDTARARSMSLYGYELSTTPNLEEFATSGLTFDRAIATSPWTLPSHASMFTGRFHFETSGDIGIPLDDTHPMLAEVLREDGYATAGFAANVAYTTRASGLSRGFARYEDYPVGWGMFLTSSWLPEFISRRILKLNPTRWRLGRKLAGPNTDDFLAWLPTRPDRPFFAFINYIDPHDPFFAPEPFRSMFASDGLPPKVLDNTGLVTPEEMEGSRVAYDGAIANTDHELGRLFQALRVEGILDSTIVIVTSDHGEQFGEHGLMLHTNSLYMPLIHVPLVIVYPPLVPSAARIEQPVSIRDIPATVLEMIHDRPDGRLPGNSLSRFWLGTDASDRIDDATPVLAEVNRSGISKSWEPVSRGPMKSLIIGDMHYILNGDGVEELYDLARDPAEEHDLSAAPEMATVLERARSALDSIVSH